MSKLFKAILMERKEVAAETSMVTFSFVPQKFDFIAGQYVRITIPQLMYYDPRGNSRDFSIVSSPTKNDLVSVAFRMSNSGFKQTLIHCPLKTLVNIEGPLGVFNLPENPTHPIVFIAGGIGITPLFSKVTFAAEKHLPHKILLLYFNINIKSSAFLKELYELKEKNHNFSFQIHFGLLGKEFIENSITSFDEPLWYIAGPPGMVQSARKIIISLGAIEEKIKTEEFSGY